MLGAAAGDIGGEELSRACLRFFDDRGAFAAWGGHSQGEPPWFSEGRDPDDGEVAADILREMLVANGHMLIIDWAEGPGAILDKSDRLFAKAGAPPIAAARRGELVRACDDIARGEAALRLMDPLSDEARDRGLVIHWWNTGGDVHAPLVLTGKALRRWRHARFGRRHAVLG